MTKEEKTAIIQEAAEFAAAYFMSLIEARVPRDDAISMANNFAIMYLATKGVITNPPADPKEPWQK